jgi:hypothetical protein
LIAEKQTESLTMWCKFHFDFTDDWVPSELGCPESLASSLLDSHEKQCQFGWTSCRFSLDCGKIRKKDLKAHERDCSYRTTDCQFCFAVLPYSLLSQHERECPSLPVECDHCGMKMKFGELDSHHLNDCEEMLIRCPYSCEELIRRKELAQHNTLFVVTHLEHIRIETEKKYASVLQVRYSFLSLFHFFILTCRKRNRRSQN